MRASTIPCPYCAETIQSAARKCRFCGEWLEDNSRLQRGERGKAVAASAPDEPRHSASRIVHAGVRAAKGAIAVTLLVLAFLIAKPRIWYNSGVSFPSAVLIIGAVTFLTVFITGVAGFALGLRGPWDSGRLQKGGQLTKAQLTANSVLWFVLGVAGLTLGIVLIGIVGSAIFGANW